jgi:hypothetical protein
MSGLNSKKPEKRKTLEYIPRLEEKHRTKID